MDQGYEWFFQGYSQNVDRAREQNFWRLSDTIILNIIRKAIPVEESRNATILDAGGGTGRWIVELGREYGAHFVLYDLSESMLEKARENIARAGMEDRVTIIRGDLSRMDAVVAESTDYAISLYSPLGFVNDPRDAASELYRVLKPGGRLLLMVQGFHNAIASKINNFHASTEELLQLEQSGMVLWTPSVPALHVFSEERIVRLLGEAGFGIVDIYGVPVFVQPGPEDFDPENRLRSSISRALDDERFFDVVLELEMKYNAQSGMANRGVNLLAVAQK